MLCSTHTYIQTKSHYQCDRAYGIKLSVYLWCIARGLGYHSPDRSAYLLSLGSASGSRRVCGQASECYRTISCRCLLVSAVRKVSICCPQRVSLYGLQPVGLSFGCCYRGHVQYIDALYYFSELLDFDCWIG